MRQGCHTLPKPPEGNLFRSSVRWDEHSVLALLPLINCKGCGRCCREIHPIRLQGYEVRRIAEYQEVPVKGLIEQLESMNLALDSDHPTHIRDVLDYSMRSPCPFRTHHCEIHEVRPVACRHFPLQPVMPPREDLLPGVTQPETVVGVFTSLCDAGRPCIEKLEEWQQ